MKVIVGKKIIKMKYIITEKQEKLIPLKRRSKLIGSVISNTDAYMEPYYYDTFTDFWHSVTGYTHERLIEDGYEIDLDSLQELIGIVFGEELKKWYYDSTDS